MQSFINSFVASNISDLLLRFEKALQTANYVLQNTSDPLHKGMMSTFIGLLWNYADGTIIFDSLGDSRLYKLSDNNITQLSKDENKAVILRDRSGKPLQRNGFVYSGNGITNALGLSNAAFHPSKTTFNTGEALVLCSDGIYQADSFPNSIFSLLDIPDTKFIIKRYFNYNSDRFNDDASLILIQNKQIDKNLYSLVQNKILSEPNNKLINVAPFIVAQVIQSEILLRIENHKNQHIQSLITYSNAFDVKFSEDFILKAFDAFKNHNYTNHTLYRLLVERLRILK